MTVRYYLSEIIGDGLTPATAFRPALVDLLTTPTPLDVLEGRLDTTKAGGWSLVRADVTNQQNNVVRADPRVLTLPFEEAGTGRVLELDESTDLMATLDRTRVVSRLEGIGVPLHDFAGKTVRAVLRRVMKRLLLRARLGPADFVEGLDTTWGQFSAGRRADMRTRLQAIGVNTTDINGPDTIRVVQQKVLDQDLPAFQVRL